MQTLPKIKNSNEKPPEKMFAENVTLWQNTVMNERIKFFDPQLHSPIIGRRSSTLLPQTDLQPCQSK
jgi:hypothetical protein